MSWGKFQKRKEFGFVSGHSSKRAVVLNLSVTHLDLELSRSVPLRLSNPYNHLDWVLHHRVLPSKIEWCLKGVFIVSSFIQGFVLCLRKYVFGVFKLVMLRNTAHCWILHRGKFFTLNFALMMAWVPLSQPNTLHNLPTKQSAHTICTPAQSAPQSLHNQSCTQAQQTPNTIIPHTLGTTLGTWHAQHQVNKVHTVIYKNPSIPNLY